MSCETSVVAVTGIGWGGKATPAGWMPVCALYEEAICTGATAGSAVLPYEELTWVGVLWYDKNSRCTCCWGWHLWLRRNCECTDDEKEPCWKNEDTFCCCWWGGGSPIWRSFCNFDVSRLLLVPFGAPKLPIGSAAGVRSWAVLSEDPGRDAEGAPSEFRCKNEVGGGFADGLAPVNGMEPKFDGGVAFLDV